MKNHDTGGKAEGVENKNIAFELFLVILSVVGFLVAVILIVLILVLVSILALVHFFLRISGRKGFFREDGIATEIGLDAEAFSRKLIVDKGGD